MGVGGWGGLEPHGLSLTSERLESQANHAGSQPDLMTEPQQTLWTLKHLVGNVLGWEYSMSVSTYQDWEK